MATKVVLHHGRIAALEDHVDSRVYSKIMGPMERDAKRYAPVDTGWLRWGIAAKHKRRWSYELRARTTPVGEYAAPVEMGHRLVAWGHETGKWVPAQPYLRPAAFTKRSL